MGRFVFRVFACLCFSGVLVGAVVGWWSRYVSPYRMQVTQVAVQLPRRRSELGGLTVAFVTDTHVGPHFRATDLEPVVAYLEELQPDLVIFGGDYICESPRFLSETQPVIERIAHTGKLGAWGILGNHDVSNNCERVVSMMESAGVSILINDSVRVETPKGDLWLAGVDDALLGKPNLRATFAEVPVDAAAICLWHEPDRASEVVEYGPFLMLSGHTHGGQVRVPGIGPLATPKLGKKYVVGRHQLDDMELIVSAGLGIYRPPVRFNCPPELTILRLLA